MKDYRRAMDKLAFTPQEKEALKARLRAAQGGPAAPPARKRRRLAAALVAAALLLSAGTVGAVKLVPDLGQRVAQLFEGQAQSGEGPVSVTDQGVTITAESVWDGFTYGVLCTIQRTDGQPLGVAPDEVGDLIFQAADLDGPALANSGGTLYFFDDDPGDSALQMVYLVTSDRPLAGAGWTLTLEDLMLLTEGKSHWTSIAPGTWTLALPEGTAAEGVALPAGQTLALEGAQATVDSVTLAPMTLAVTYTVDGTWDDPDQGEARWVTGLPLAVTFSDGATRTLETGGTSAQTQGDRTLCRKSGFLGGTYTPADIQSVTIGGVTIPVGAG